MNQEDEQPPAPNENSPWRYLIGLLSVAFAAAGFAIAFRWTLSFALLGLAGTDDVVAAAKRAPWPMRLVAPAIGGLVAGLAGMVSSREPQGRGVGAVMEAVVLGRTRISLPLTLLRSLGSWAAIATGGSLGREGPLIQFGGAAGSFFSGRLGLSAQRTRILIAAGTAAGFAAAYNTPLTAVLFVLEIVSGLIVVDMLVPSLVAVVIATVATRVVVGAGPIYGARSFALRSPLEIVAFAGLGIVAALVAQAFMRGLTAVEHLFARSRLGLPWRTALGGLLAGGVVIFVPDVAGNGYEPLNRILDGAFPVTFVAMLLLAKAVATTASVSSGNPGGVFTPTLLLGGAAGFVYGEVLRGLLGGAVGPAGGYALVGMAATTAATTHAPVMAAVMAFELSGDYAIVLPLMLATAVATYLSRVLRPDSIYMAEVLEEDSRWDVTLEGRQRRGDRRNATERDS